jgi:hypothetical protein
MPIIALITIPSSPPIDSTLGKLEEILKASSTRFVIGTQAQNPNTIQITAEWPEKSPNNWVSNVRALNSLTPSITLANFAQSPFAFDSPPLVEYVKIDFSASSCTSAFQSGIESDFARFEEILRRRGSMKECGEVFLTTGWAEAEGEGEEAIKSFVVVRGWEGMSRFEQAVSTEEFKEAVPILIGWGAPYKLVCLR